MALVAILHLVEALLIFVSGHQHASPMYFKHSSGRIVGGFSLQKFWPMPTIALIGAAVLGTGMEWETIAMPDWWPIFQSGVAVPPGPCACTPASTPDGRFGLQRFCPDRAAQN